MSFVEEAIYDEYDPANDLCRDDLAIILVQDKKELQLYDDIDVEQEINICEWPVDEDEIVEIFGYPVKSKGLLQGQHGDAALNKDKGLWEYEDIHTYPGQSGSAIYKKIKKIYGVYGVHIFGNTSKQENCGIYLDRRKIQWIKDVVDKFESVAISRAPKESLVKTKLWYQNTVKLMKKEIDTLIHEGYDNNKAIKCLSTTDLKDLQVMDGHIPKIMRFVEQLKTKDDDSKYDKAMGIKVWLKDVVSLDEGDIQILMDKGFDDMVAMQSLSDKQLKEMKIKRGHRKQIMFYVNKMIESISKQALLHLMIADQRYIELMIKRRTMMDDFSQYILSQKWISTQESANIFSFLYLEYYDSDALEFEINIKNTSYTKRIVKSNKGFESLRYFINHYSVSSIYQVGFDFKYWNYYRNCNITDTIPKDEDWFNVNDYGGYSPHELCVERKYNNLKEEVLTTHLIDMEEFNEATKKANECLETHKVRRLKAADVDNEYHYDIKAGTPLSFGNIMSIILFEDNLYSELCNYFRSTFTKSYSTEIIDSVKRRNSEVWHWSKILRETVTYFGKTEKEWDGKEWIDNERGPFYLAGNRVMNIAQFNIRLYGPISLTTQIKIAVRFSGRNGMIVELNVDEYYNDKLRIFNSSWISKYEEEDSRICFGGDYAMKLESIRIRSAVINFEFSSKVFYLFDCMLSGTNMSNINFNSLVISQEEYEYISDLITYFSTPSDLTQNDVHQYILDSFQSFIRSKSQIVINLWCIHKWFETLKGLVIDSKNMLKPEIVDLFPNLKKIIIYSTSRNGKHTFRFDLSALVSMVYDRAKNNNTVIVVKARWPKSKCYTLSDDEESDDEKEKVVKHSWIQGEIRSLAHKITIDNQSLSISGKYSNEDCLIISKYKKWSTKCLFDSNITIEQCTLKDMLFILEYGFSEAAKKENRTKE